MDIDFVIPWVDGSDENWRRERAEYDPNMNGDANTEVRYRDWENLEYWFRGVETYAPWVHKIYFLTWGHVPQWLNLENPKLVIVNHRDYIPSEYLPTFNSHTIELNMHRIPGLSEHFVYFNDDVFVTKPTQPEDFFKDGKPVDEFILDAVYFSPTSAGHYIGNDLEVINAHFRPREQFKKLRLGQYLNPGYGLQNLYRTIVLKMWPWYTGFYCSHISASFLRSTLEEVWEKAPEILERTCREKFRTKENVNQWLFKFWQLAKGDFSPRSLHFGRSYHLGAAVNQELLTAIETNRFKVLCINDSDATGSFEAQKAAIIASFQKILPEKSSFEK